MELKWLSIVVCLLAVALAAVSVIGAPTSDQEILAAANSDTSMRASFSPTKLFDFVNYKQVFKKTYSSLVEELVRAKYYLSRAFRSFISALKYKYRKSRFYLAVNEMSDWTQEEIDESENKVLAKASEERIAKAKAEFKRDESAASQHIDDLPNIMPEDVSEVEREFKKLADSAKPGEPGYEELRRVTEESAPSEPIISQRQSGKLRDLPIEKLIDTGEDAKLNPEAARKLTNSVPGNNPQYEPFELQSYGLSDEPKPVTFWAIKPKVQVNPAADFTAALNNAINGLQNQGDSSGKEDEDAIFHDAVPQLPDEVFVDLRETGCLSIPRQQGKCGSCWSFAATAIFEFLYCMKTDKLVPFSEQYMIDCSKNYIEGAYGCEGGLDDAPPNFVKNFGLELRINYPYNMRENECPYEESTNLDRTGYIRFHFEDAVQIDIKYWPDYIKNSPIYIGISLAPGFREYGGGVFGWGCNQKRASHAVVLVGHGREDGEEYWLIRNSHSVGWGEGGYGKLAKSANCAPERIGWFYASQDGEKVEYKINNNKLNDRSVVREHYMKSMLL